MKGISEIIATILMLMITIGLAGTAYLFISAVFSRGMQGIEIVDAFCIKETTGKDNSTIVVRNLGTTSIDKSSISVVQTSPVSTTEVRWTPDTITPGSVATMYDECEGSGSRTCIYRIMSSAGRSIVAAISCA